MLDVDMRRKRVNQMRDEIVNNKEENEFLHVVMSYAMKGGNDGIQERVKVESVVAKEK
jgi:hypothetical protein